MTAKKRPEEIKKAGAPTLYKKEYGKMAYFCCLLGASSYGLAVVFNVTTEIIENWIKTIPEFHKSILKAYYDYPKYQKKAEERKAKRRIYRKQGHIRLHQNNYVKNKLKVDPHFKLRFNISAIMRHRLKNNVKTGVFRNFDYTIKDLIKHLEKQFTSGMTWENYGKVWHVDHKIPDSWFKYESVNDEGFKKAWSLNNLQPLLKADNLKKGNRYAST